MDIIIRYRDDSHIHGNDGARHEGRCATQRKTKLRYVDTIKRAIRKNGLTDINILDGKDWRVAVSMATTDMEGLSRREVKDNGQEWNIVAHTIFTSDVF